MDETAGAHRSVTVSTPFGTFALDEAIVPVVAAAHRAGIRTDASCAGEPVVIDVDALTGGIDETSWSTFGTAERIGHLVTVGDRYDLGYGPHRAYLSFVHPDGGSRFHDLVLAAIDRSAGELLDPELVRVRPRSTSKVLSGTHEHAIATTCARWRWEVVDGAEPFSVRCVVRFPSAHLPALALLLDGIR